MTLDPKVGRCQHCHQTRPVFQYDATFDNGEPIWDTPCPEFWAAQGTWLCARHWEAAETARLNGRTFHVEHDLEVWPFTAGKTRIWAYGTEVLTQADQDLRTCEAILGATEERPS